MISGDVAAQTERVLQNLSGILKAAGSGLEKVVRSTVFLKNMGDFAAMNEVYGQLFHIQRRRPDRRSRSRVCPKMCWWRLM